MGEIKVREEDRVGRGGEAHGRGIGA